MIFAGTKDGTNYGFYLENDGLIDYIELTEEEHISLIDGQANGKVIQFHKDKKPTLEIPPEPSDYDKAKQRIVKLKKYLTQTDWYAIRYIDSGKEIPAEIKNKRQEARDEISTLSKLIEKQ